MRLYQIGLAALRHLQTSVCSETEGIKSSDKILLSSICCTDITECTVPVWICSASEMFTFRLNAAEPLYLKRQWFRAEGFGLKHVLKLELLSVKEYTQNPTCLAGLTNTSPDYFWIFRISLEKWNYHLVYISLFPVNQNSLWKITKLINVKPHFPSLFNNSTLLTVSVTAGVYFKLEIMKTVWRQWPTTGTNNFCRVSNVMCFFSCLSWQMI